MPIHTRLCDQFGVVHPILNAPMGGGDAPAELAAAVAQGGGLGMIGGTTAGDTTWLVDQIHRARDLTDRPFGVGILSHRPSRVRLMDAALDEGIKVIAHSFADPAPFVGPAHDAGAVVICQVRTLEDARRAAAVGVDVITAEGTEAGGHTGYVSTIAARAERCRRRRADCPSSRQVASPTAGRSPWPSCSAPKACGSARAFSPRTSVE